MSESVESKAVGKRPRRLGEYQIVDEIGRGGMGVVYKARQASMGREVALKVLPSFASMDVDAVARFRREAEAAGRLAHPGIVPIYSVGEAEGIHYYAMELVDGPSFAALLDELVGRLPERLLGSLIEEAGFGDRYPQLRNPPPGGGPGTAYARSCAALVADVAAALGAAHAAKIIHRDLKPSNVLIHRSGWPVLVDFGLARDDSANALTRTGDTVGTPAYMAPEQAAGKREADSRIDVYGLGATLYELLTLRPPFDGAHAAEIMRQIMTEEPVPVRKHNTRVPVDLETIVLKCLAKDADDRYPCIEALELDLRAFLDGRGIAARPPSGRKRMLRFWQRHRKAVLAAAGALVIAAVAGGTMGLVSMRRTSAEGARLLEAAGAALIERADVSTARELYGRATALLQDGELLERARIEHARRMFDRWYGDEARRPALRSYFDSLTAAETEALRAYVDRLAGQGRLVLRGLAADELAAATVELRALRDGRLLPPVTVRSGAVLDVGDYSVRVTIPGRATIVQAVSIQRDAEVDLPLRSHSLEEIPVAMAPVSGEVAADDFAIATTELTVAEYQGLLDGIDDPLLAAELTPAGWSEQQRAVDLPVRGLSFGQARAASRRFGAHLPSRREYLRAANGGLSGLHYPWGGDIGADCIAADPDQLGAPLRADSCTAGATASGVLHVVGNVAEVLAAELDGTLWIAGGHYQSRQEQLRLDRPDLLFQRLTSVVESRPYSGMRLARFLPQPDTPRIEQAAAERRQQFLQAGTSLVHDWHLDANGAVKYQITVTGIHTRAESEKELPLPTEGFVQVRDVEVSDGHGRRLEVRRLYSVKSGESSRWLTSLSAPGPAGARYRLGVSAWLEPALGLRGVLDGFVLQIPLTVVGAFPVMHRVVLPPGCRIDDVQPLPSTVYFSNDSPTLVWEFLADGAGKRTIPGIVRFRRDGALSDLQLATVEVESVVRRFLSALQSGDRQVLAQLLHHAFCQSPADLGRQDLLEGVGVEGGRHHAYGAPRIHDVTSVGAVVTVEFEADWTARYGGGERLIAGWPMRLQLRREGAADWSVLRFLPASRADTGHIDASVYRHPRLKVRLQPSPRVTLQRTQDEMVEMQVRYSELADVGFVVLGHYATSDESDAQALVRLTSGVGLLGRGQQVGADERAMIGPSDRPLVGQALDWVFPGGTERPWTRERWVFLRKGLRCFLIREIAQGVDAAGAEARFRDHSDWFAAMAATVHID